MKMKASRINYRLENITDVNVQGDPKVLRTASLGSKSNSFSSCDCDYHAITEEPVCTCDILDYEPPRPP